MKLLHALLIIACSNAAAIVLHFMKEAPVQVIATAPPPPAPKDDLVAARLNALENEVRRIERAKPREEKKAAPKSLPDMIAAAESFDPGERNDNLRLSFDTEGRIEPWASETEEAVRSALSPVLSEQVKLARLACGERSCRIELALASSSDRSRIQHELPFLLPSLPRLRFELPADEAGERTIAFVASPG